MKTAYGTFLLVLILGIVTLTLAYREAQTSLAGTDTGVVKELTDAQRALLESQQAMSKWLLALTYATFVGLLSLSKRKAVRSRFISVLPLAASGLLLVALYAAFLFQDAIVFALSKGPISLIYGPLLQWPLLAQFWCLVGALAVLGLWLYGPHSRALLVLAIVIAAGARPVAQAPNGKGQAVKRCLLQWRMSRQIMDIDAGEFERGAVSLFDDLMKQTSYTPSVTSCDYYFTMLDGIRAGHVLDTLTRLAQLQSPASLPEFVELADKSLERPGLSQDGMIGRLIDMTALWRAPSGLLVVKSAKPYEIVIDGSFAGISTMMARLPAGSYKIEAIDETNKKLPDATATVISGKTTNITMAPK